jgi:hypothetical protein
MSLPPLLLSGNSHQKLDLFYKVTPTKGHSPYQATSTKGLSS